jgi:hypothetical protein
LWGGARSEEQGVLRHTSGREEPKSDGEAADTMPRWTAYVTAVVALLAGALMVVQGAVAIWRMR